MKDTWEKYLAEFVATFILVFIAAGAVLANWQSGGTLGIVGVALATGLALAAMIYGIASVSGAHINPAVTAAFMVTGRMPVLTGIGYIVAQLLGGVLAAFVLRFVFPGVSPQFYLGGTVLANGVSPSLGILVEALFTFFLVWTIFGATSKKSPEGFVGLAAGSVLAFSIMVAGGITMGSLNPARSFGPALLSSYWVNHYVYWVGPLVGGILAGLVYDMAFTRRNRE